MLVATSRFDPLSLVRAAFAFSIAVALTACPPVRGALVSACVVRRVAQLFTQPDRSCRRDREIVCIRGAANFLRYRSVFQCLVPSSATRRHSLHRTKCM
jgi:hypothetical protein